MLAAEHKKEFELKTGLEQKPSQAQQKGITFAGKRIALSTIEEADEIRPGSHEPLNPDQIKSFAVDCQALKAKLLDDVLGNPVEWNTVVGNKVWVSIDEADGDIGYGSLVAVYYKKIAGDNGPEIGTQPVYGVIVNSLPKDAKIPDLFDIQIGHNTLLKDVPAQFVRIFKPLP